MTGDFAEFFEEVQRAAKKHGIRAHLVCGVSSDGTGGQVKVASNGHYNFDEKDTQFLLRCVEAMSDSTDELLTRLGAGPKVAEPKLMN